MLSSILIILIHKLTLYFYINTRIIFELAIILAAKRTLSAHR